MENFTLEFTYDHHPHTAGVSVLTGANHIQYTITPNDLSLREEFSTQVIHRFGDKLEFAFPGEGKEEKRYNAAIAKALHTALRLEPDVSGGQG